MRVPSKKVSLYILGAVLIVTAIISFSTYSEKKSSNTTSPNALSKNFEIQIALETGNQEDVDNDGLLDWEESLWGTDINNSDSDGDGTSDGNEVAQNRNPNVSGPNDTNYDLETKIIEDLYNKGVDSESLTNQATIAFINTYFELKKNGNLTQENKEKLISDIVNASFENSGLINLSPPHTENSVKTFPNNEQDMKIEYVQKMFDVQSQYGTLISLYSDQDDYEKTLATLTTLSNKIIDIRAPEELKFAHLNLANGYYMLGQSIAFMDSNKSDSIASMFGLNIYQETLLGMESTGIEFNNFLITNGIFNDNGVFKIDYE